MDGFSQPKEGFLGGGDRGKGGKEGLRLFQISECVYKVLPIKRTSNLLLLRPTKSEPPQDSGDVRQDDESITPLKDAQ